MSRAACGRRSGFALMLVMAFMAVSFMIISGLLTWTSENAVQGQRHQEFYTTLEAPNAAVEVVVANMLNDLKEGGLTAVWTRHYVLPDNYVYLAESEMDAPEWDEYDYPLPVTVEPFGSPSYSPLLWKYQGLTASNQMYRIRAGARRELVDGIQAAAIEMDVQVAEIPVFAFAALYNFDLSFVTPPGQNTTLNGHVHGNRDIYVNPSGSLTFGGDVTAANAILQEQHPDDEPRAAGSVSYQAEHDGRVNSLNLVPATTDARLQILQDYQLRAHLIIRVVSDDEVETSKGPFGDPVSLPQWTNFLVMNRLTFDPPDPGPIEFFDQRELKVVRAVQFDVGAFAATVGSSDSIVYVEDMRATGSTEILAGVRLVNGRQLPANGLTFVTPHPLYVQGDYNAPVLGSSDTSLAKPAALVADAVTVLSAMWDDAKPNNVETEAQSTTVNAAILTGIVPSEGGAFDGGLFNALRLLENWTHRTLTFNGSIVALFRSQYAVEPWRGDLTVYQVPDRQWTYDAKLQDPNYLPWTPVVSALIRANWSRVAPEVVFAD
jgi:hypothetical protein